MRKALFRPITIVAVAVVSTAIAWSGTAYCASVSFKVPLSGGQEVTPVFPAGAATAHLTYDPLSVTCR